MRIEVSSAATVMANLHAASFGEAWEEAAFATLLASPGVTALVAIRAQAPVGFVLARVAANEAEILTLAVAPAQRRQGVGRALVEAAAQTASRAGADVLFLEVADDNTAALALYAGCGFTQTGLRKGYYARGGARVDALALRRDLNTPPGDHYA